jgi:hypothetical protein
MTLFGITIFFALQCMGFSLNFFKFIYAITNRGSADQCSGLQTGFVSYVPSIALSLSFLCAQRLLAPSSAITHARTI